MGRMSFPSLLKSAAILIKSRVEPIFIWSWCTAISCLIVGRGFPPIKPVLMVVFAMICISTSVYLYNDIIDKEMDSINPIKQNRPIVSNMVSEKDVMKIIYLFGFIGLTITLFLNIYSFIFSFIYLFLFNIYSYPKIRLKTKFLGKEFTIFLGWLLCSQVASYAIIGSFSFLALFCAILIGFFAISVIPVFADSFDIDEDRLYGVKNLSVLLSWKRKMQLLIFAFFVVMTMTPLTYVQFGFNIVMPIIVVAMSLIFLRFMFPIVNEFEQIKVMKVKKIARIYFILLQILIALGSIKFTLFI